MRQNQESQGREGGPSTPVGLPHWGPRLAPALIAIELYPRDGFHES